MEIQANGVFIQFAEGPLNCPVNDSNLPVIQITSPSEASNNAKALNACVMAENNQNLTPSQKELLKWLAKFGHIPLKDVQKIMKSGALGWSPQIKAASHLDLDKSPLICAPCSYAKAKRRANRPKTT